MNKIRNHFPILNTKINNKPFVYLDNAATTQKPQQVIDAITYFYQYQNAPIHRSVYYLAEQATQLIEEVRHKVANFIAGKFNEIIFTKGTTEGINFIAATWATNHLKKDDEIVLTEMEHHANLLPWQQIAAKTGARLRFIPITADGTLNLGNIDAIITVKTKLVSLVHTSHALGTVNDLEPIIKKARAIGAKVMVDAAQAAPYQPINVKELDCDFLVFSGHKMLAPTGIGVLYISEKIQSEVPPYQFGGGMVYEADYYKATWLTSPARYEAGTLPVAQIIGLGAALDFIQENIDFNELKKHLAQLCAQAIEGLESIPGITILGPKNQLQEKGHLVSFLAKGFHPHDVGAFLDQYGIAVRTGHYCAQPLAKKLGIDGSIRMSFYAYNTPQEVELCINAIKQLVTIESF